MPLDTFNSISGLVVEYIVAIDVTRVRFPADALYKTRGIALARRGHLPEQKGHRRELNPWRRPGGMLRNASPLAENGFAWTQRTLAFFAGSAMQHSVAS